MCVCVCVCVCVCPLKWAGLNKLSMQEIQRFGLLQRIPGWLPSIRILLDICAHHQPDRRTGRRGTQLDQNPKHSLFICLSEHVGGQSAVAGSIFGCLHDGHANGKGARGCGEMRTE